ncbi:cell pole-organizing protein PopZ [Sphingomonas sp. UYAg733]
MGDVSAEPSMEDILSSIKRIIAEEGDAAVSARGARKPVRPVAPAPRADIDDFGTDEILELSDPVRAAEHTAILAPAAEPPVQQQPLPVAADSILSAHATQASRGPLEALSRMVVKPEVTGSDTLEGMVREMIRPMLRDWLDSHLPAMVETMVAREIARITGQTR